MYLCRYSIAQHNNDFVDKFIAQDTQQATKLVNTWSSAFDAVLNTTVAGINAQGLLTVATWSQQQFSAAMSVLNERIHVHVLYSFLVYAAGALVVCTLANNIYESRYEILS